MKNEQGELDRVTKVLGLRVLPAPTETMLAILRHTRERRETRLEELFHGGLMTALKVAAEENGDIRFQAYDVRNIIYLKPQMVFNVFAAALAAAAIPEPPRPTGNARGMYD